MSILEVEWSAESYSDSPKVDVVAAESGNVADGLSNRNFFTRFFP